LTPERWYIGRRHVADSCGDPVVIDWRAGVSTAFYRAAPAEPMGVILRRRFGIDRGQLTAYEDERFDGGDGVAALIEPTFQSQILVGEIERPRVGPMRDIVATIQPEQDAIVRCDVGITVCIQGAPGTGKTAVGLHRAAYLLYSYPERLRRSGVLVVGPNRAFLHYIAQVLPALGEGGIAQSTVAELVGRLPVGAEEDVSLATLKGDARMAAVLSHAVRTQIAKPVGDVVALVGTRRYRISEHRLRR